MKISNFFTIQVGLLAMLTLGLCGAAYYYLHTPSPELTFGVQPEQIVTPEPPSMVEIPVAPEHIAPAPQDC